MIRYLTALLVWAALSAYAPRAGSAETGGFQSLLDRYQIAYKVPASGKAILVNIPAFELIAFNNGVPVLRSRVIVGAP